MLFLNGMYINYFILKDCYNLNSSQKIFSIVHKLSPNGMYINCFILKGCYNLTNINISKILFLSVEGLVHIFYNIIKILYVLCGDDLWG